MESIPDWSTFLPLPRIGSRDELARATLPVITGSADSVVPRIATLWRETITTFVTHAGPVIISAWIGFAAIAAVIQGLRALIGLTPASNLWVFLLATLMGLLLHMLAQGALAWIGLHGGSSNALSLADAWHAAMAGWRGLLPGVLLHTTVTFVCVLSLTPALISSSLMSVNLVPNNLSPVGLPDLAVVRNLDTAALGLLHPLGEWMTPARAIFLPMFLQRESPGPDEWLTMSMQQHMESTIPHANYAAPMAALPAGLIALAGLAVLVAGGVLFRFYSAAAVGLEQRAVPALPGTLGPVLESAHLGVRHARLVFFNAVTLRMLMRAVELVCLLLTTSVAETVVLPRLALSSGALWIVPAGRLACLIGSAGVSALLTAFCALYDARLYVALQLSTLLWYHRAIGVTSSRRTI